MEDRTADKEDSITKEFRTSLKANKSEESKSTSSYNKGKSDSSNNSNSSKNVKDSSILGKAINDLSQESLIQGLIYSEILGQPKCKRRGW